MRLTVLLPLLSLVATPAVAQDERLARIIDQGMNHSQVMLNAQQLADDIGGRLTNSPAMRKAEDWAMQRFRGVGVSYVRKEAFPFGRGWAFDHASVMMTSPRPLALRATPIAWTPPTEGLLRAHIIVAPMSREEDFAQWRGKLRGKIVLFTLPSAESLPEDTVRPRLSDEDIAALGRFVQSQDSTSEAERDLARRSLDHKVDAFLHAEGALAWVRMSRTEDGLVHGESYNYQRGRTPSLPGFEIAAKDYRRLARLAKMGPPPVLELLSDARYYDTDPNAYNIIAEIPGADPKAGYVMVGAHLDSWFSGDGAADDGAGCAIVVEAARLLAESGVQPKRSIRFALWAGEEQGLLGSTAYIEKYLATRLAPAEPENGVTTLVNWPKRFPVTPKAGYGDMAAYFNLDSGSGKVRGIRAQNNIGALPLLERWLQPFATMGAGNAAIATSGRSDHYLMRLIGLPAFGFLQDPLDYGRNHHSELDTFVHLRGDDMRQAATVVAGVLLQAAESDKRLPRQPIPTATQKAPYDYQD